MYAPKILCRTSWNGPPFKTRSTESLVLSNIKYTELRKEKVPEKFQGFIKIWKTTCVTTVKCTINFSIKPLAQSAKKWFVSLDGKYKNTEKYHITAEQCGIYKKILTVNRLFVHFFFVTYISSLKNWLALYLDDTWCICVWLFHGNKSNSAEVINMQGWDNYLLKDTEWWKCAWNIHDNEFYCVSLTDNWMVTGW